MPTQKQLNRLQLINAKALDKTQRDTERQIISYYTQSLKNIQSEIAAYEAKGVLTRADMGNYNRLVNLQASIDKEVGKLSGKVSATTKSSMIRTYEESYYRTAFVMEKGVGAKLSYGMINPKVLENVVRNPLDSIGPLARSKVNHQLMLRQIKDQLALGLNQGKGYREIAKAVEERIDIGKSRAMTIVQTEAHRCKERGNNDSQEHAANKGVELKRRWISTLDDKTRDSHGDLDGQEVGVDEEFTVNGSKLMYPGDSAGPPEEVINCRCTVISVIAGFEPTQRRAQGEDVVPYTNYNDWDKARKKGG